MRLTKMFGLAAVAAVAAMAFLGASPASATNTQLCQVHTGLTCPAGQGTTSVHWVGEGWDMEALFWPTILCLNVLKLATPLGLGNPQEVHTTELILKSCGTNAPHDNCEITVLNPPLYSLLKTGLGTGVLTDLSGEMEVNCSGIIECTYDTSEVEFAISGQDLTATNQPIAREGSGFCPKDPNLDGLLLPLVPTHVLQ